MNKLLILVACCISASVSTSVNAAFFAGFSAYDVDGDGSLGFPTPGPSLLNQTGFFLYDDCNDLSSAASPYTPEVTDGIDNNCDTITDNLGGAFGFLPNAVIDSANTNLGTDLTVDASSSSGANGTGAITTYHWFLDDSGQAILSTSNASDVISWSTLASLGYGEGSYLIGLVVQDDGGGMTYKGNGSLNIAAVPIPAAVWLFGSGLLGLVGMAGRKAA